MGIKWNKLEVRIQELVHIVRDLQKENNRLVSRNESLDSRIDTLEEENKANKKLLKERELIKQKIDKILISAGKTGMR